MPRFLAQLLTAIALALAAVLGIGGAAAISGKQNLASVTQRRNARHRRRLYAFQ